MSACQTGVFVFIAWDDVINFLNVHTRTVGFSPVCMRLTLVSLSLFFLKGIHVYTFRLPSVLASRVGKLLADLVFGTPCH